MYGIVRNVGSGSCLFYAIAQGIIHRKNIDDTYVCIGNDLRKIAVATMEKRSKKNSDYRMLLSVSYINDVLQDSSTEADYSSNYLNWMSKKTSWAGDFEIKALEKYIHSLNISGVRIYYADVVNGGQQYLHPINGFGTKMLKKKYPPIKLILHDASSGGIHFEYIFKIKKPVMKKTKKPS